MELMEINVSEVIVGERARKAYDFLSSDSLERSIRSTGVLQPIGITRDKKLIFGARRLRACKKLGMQTIPARVFDMDADNLADALMMERDENEQRVGLTPSEKVALATQIEESLGCRRGQRTDLRSTQDTESELVVNRPQVQHPSSGVETRDTNPESEPVFGRTQAPHIPPGVKTRDVAAKAVGMATTTYRRAKAVVASGDHALIEQMDSGQKSIQGAFESIKPKAVTQVFRVTLLKHPTDDAEILMSKGGRDYCTKLGVALLKAAGHHVKV